MKKVKTQSQLLKQGSGKPHPIQQQRRLSSAMPRKVYLDFKTLLNETHHFPTNLLNTLLLRRFYSIVQSHIARRIISFRWISPLLKSDHILYHSEIIK